MATTKPRITVTLSESDHATLKQLAAFQGVSMSSIVAELIESAAPALARIVEVLQEVSQMMPELQQKFGASVVEAEGTITPKIEALFAEMMGVVEAGKAEANPRNVNTGVR
jgi:hypothetical protein